jgi:hypothetical protein
MARHTHWLASNAEAFTGVAALHQDVSRPTSPLRDAQRADTHARASRKSSNFLKQPFFLPGTTIRAEGVWWIVAREKVNQADRLQTRRA